MNAPDEGPVRAVLDHLVYATPHLEDTVAWLADRLGVEPAPGGQHPGLGTRNYLLGLGDGAYLEIIGVDRSQPAPAQPRPFGIDELQHAELATWAARVDDIDAAVAAARAVGHDPGDPIALERLDPSGNVLRWRLTLPDVHGPWAGVVPFLIDWGDTPHPSASAPSGVRLAGFRATHPGPKGVSAALASMGARVGVSVGPPELYALLAGPKGELQLT